MVKKLFVSPDGVIRAILDDKLDNPKLGSRSITRESHLNFRDALNKWRAYVGVDVIAEGDTRAEALVKEHKYVEARLEKEIREKIK